MRGQREPADASWPKPLTFLFAESAGELAGAGVTYPVLGFGTSGSAWVPTRPSQLLAGAELAARAFSGV